MSRLVLAAVVSLGIGAGALVGVVDGSAAAQSDGNGLEEVSINRFFIDPTAGVVKVEVDITIRNVTSNTTSGNVVSRTYFNGYGVVVPAGAEHIVATQDGRTLDGELLTDGPTDAFAFYRFDLAGRIFNGQSARIMVTYDHTGLPPRSEIPWRANSAYTSYVAFGLGDTGSVTIEILQPAGYEFDEFTDLTDFDASAPNEFGVVTHTRSGLDEEFSIVVGLSNDDKLVSTPLDVDGVDLEIRSWPGDDEWLAFATSKVESGLPELEELIGSAWPPVGEFDIRQTVEPNLYGYAGWFDSRASEIAVGEELDADTLYHELSHGWFNGDVFRGRWLGEGFAQIYAAAMIERDGDEARQPSEPGRNERGRQPLTSWTTFGSSDADTFEAEEDYAYNASFWVMQQIVDEIGFERLADVFAAAVAGATTYPIEGEDPVQRTTNAVDWRYMLDAFERLGGSTTVDAVFRQHVVPEDRFDDLDSRRSAIEAYDTLATQVAPWTMPVALRDALDRWAFERAGELTEAAGAVLGLRSELTELAASTRIAATSLDAAGADFAVSDDDFVAVSNALDDDIVAATTMIERQRLVADTAVVAGVTPPALYSEAAGRPVGFVAATAVADDQAKVLDELIAATAIIEAERSLAQRIGLYGREPGDDVDAARSAIEAGDNELARARLAGAVDTVQGAEDAGQSRITTAIVAAASVLFVLLALTAWARRHRRNVTVAGSGGGAVEIVDEFGQRRVDLDEDAFAGARLGGVNDIVDVPSTDVSKAPRATRVVQSGTALGDVGDPVLELHEDIGAVVDADSIAGTEVLIDPDTHDEAER